MRKRRFIALLALLVLVTGAVGLVSLWSHRADGKGRPDRGPGATETAMLPAAISAGGAMALEEALVSTADTVVDSVVSIEVEVPIQSQVVTLQEGWPFSDPFSDPFGDPFELFRKFRQRQSPRVTVHAGIS